MNFIDKLILYVAPGTALKRAQARAMHRTYEFADKTRRGKNLVGRQTSANTELVNAHQTLVNRSRQTIQNDGFAKKGQQVFATNVVGTGINPVIKSSSTRNGERAKAAWKQWAQTTDIDVQGFQTFAGILALASRAIFSDGEFLARRVQRSYKPGEVPFQYMMLECDYIDGQRNGTLENGNRIIHGIEVDKFGRPVNYWLFDEHPGEMMRLPFSMVSKPVPADEIIHVFPQWRPGQLRGIPYLATVGLRLNDYKDYEDAQLIRQKVAASWAVFITKPNSQLPIENDPETGLGFERIAPGMIEYLRAGENIEFAAPPATENYEEYARAILRNVAAGLGISYEALTGDLTGVNFSSGRMGFIEMHKQIEEIQRLVIIPQLCEKVFKQFMLMGGTLSGLFNPSTITVAWTPPRRQFIDPLKEIMAIQSQLHNGVSSFGEIARQLGYDPDELLDDIEYWQKEFDKKGIKMGFDARFFPGVKYPENVDNNDENTANPN